MGGDGSVARVERAGDGIWRWVAPHPEWHPRTPFGAEVASYAIRAGSGTLLVDPLVPSEPGFLESLDRIVAGRVRIVITIPYHVRSAGALRERYGATIHGHPAVVKRLGDASGFQPIEAGVPLDGGIVPVGIGKPRRYETPLFIPDQRAVVFGDAVVEADGALRVWMQREVTPARLAWYAERLRPTLEPLLDLDVDRVLVTHGAPVLSGGRSALDAALDAGPWYHRPN
jgi:glyoxylase-like metal-dependent hydrolase (beta-lactamase superfamily II)